jgi:hypothetical protein
VWRGPEPQLGVWVSQPAQAGSQCGQLLMLQPKAPPIPCPWASCTLHPRSIGRTPDGASRRDGASWQDGASRKTGCPRLWLALAQPRVQSMPTLSRVRAGALRPVHDVGAKSRLGLLP